ncbi:MAG TPA: NDP-sugar synthase [Armatimonadota bacterium]|nr:NDP-sugar synthase [Armatimonadota bacterium]
MQAVVLAGGKGTRLYPLTCDTPKPMLRLFNKPVLEHTIELLKRHDISDIMITLAYKAEQIIDYFGSGSKWGVNIQYSLEEAPQGTAGGLRRIQPLLRDTFIVVSGDAVTDLDLRAAHDFHKKRSAIATMLVYESEKPSHFGIVESTDDGKIQRFLEKPRAREAFTNTINTGIYILEPEVLSYIPYDAVYDFSRNVFPSLLQNQEPFYSYRADGYWCDIGSLGQYRNVHFDALTGKVKLNLPASRIADGMWIGEDTDIHPSVTVRAPFYVGNKAHIRRNSALGRFAVIGDMSFVDEDAQITHSVVGPCASVGRATQVYGSVLGAGFRLADGKNLDDEVVVHDGSSIELRAEITPELLSQLAGDEHMFTWSGLELARLARDVISIQPMAA